MTTFSEYKLLNEEYVEHQHTQLGSNEGGVYTHQPSGQKMYVKFPKSEEQARVEAATADIYNALGIRTLNPRVKHIDGKSAVVTKWNPDVKSLTSPRDYRDLISNKARENELALIHHAAIITGNRDVIGMDYTNVMHDKTTGELVSADQGGSMHFRAQGGSKPFDSSIQDVHSFQNPAYESGRVFSMVSPEALKRTSDSLSRLTDDKIDAIMKKHGLENHSESVKSRKRNLISYYQTTQ